MLHRVQVTDTSQQIKSNCICHMLINTTGVDFTVKCLLTSPNRQCSLSTYVVPTMKHGGGGVMVWGWFAGDTVCDLFSIQDTFNQHGYHSILKQYPIPSGLRLEGLSFVFQQDNDATHLQAV